MATILHGSVAVIARPGRAYTPTSNTASHDTGLKITAGHRTMSDQDDYLSGQNLGLAVILTGHVRGLEKKLFALFLENTNS